MPEPLSSVPFGSVYPPSLHDVSLNVRSRAYPDPHIIASPHLESGIVYLSETIQSILTILKV